jgi:hypothetical protein
VSETTAFELDARDRKRLAARLAGSTPIAVRTSEGEIGLPPVAQRAVEQLLDRPRERRRRARARRRS